MRRSGLVIIAVLVVLALVGSYLRDQKECAEGKSARVSATIKDIRQFKLNEQSYWIVYLNKGARSECAIEKLSPDREPPSACKAGSPVEAEGNIYREGWLQVGDIQCKVPAG
jgi:hypothetical protein